MWVIFIVIYACTTTTSRSLLVSVCAEHFMCLLFSVALQGRCSVPICTRETSSEGLRRLPKLNLSLSSSKACLLSAHRTVHFFFIFLVVMWQWCQGQWWWGQCSYRCRPLSEQKQDSAQRWLAAEAQPPRPLCCTASWEESLGADGPVHCTYRKPESGDTWKRYPEWFVFYSLIPQSLLEGLPSS